MAEIQLNWHGLVHFIDMKLPYVAKSRLLKIQIEDVSPTKSNEYCKFSTIYCNRSANLRYLIKNRMKLNRIKVVLVEESISQTQLAKELGKSFSTINVYCGNHQQPSLEILSKIAELLSVSIKDLNRSS